MRSVMDKRLRVVVLKGRILLGSRICYLDLNLNSNCMVRFGSPYATINSFEHVAKGISPYSRSHSGDVLHQATPDNISITYVPWLE